jgi:hypothetical protein
LDDAAQRREVMANKSKSAFAGSACGAGKWRWQKKQSRKSGQDESVRIVPFAEYAAGLVARLRTSAAG